MTLDEMRALAERQNNTKHRKKPSDLEHKIQCACVRWFRLQYHQLSHALFAVPNGGRRDVVIGAKLKEEGVLAGVSDLILLCPNSKYYGLLIEMKTPTGKQSDKQVSWAMRIAPLGYHYVVCHSIEEFMKEVNEYLRT